MHSKNSRPEPKKPIRKKPSSERISGRWNRFARGIFPYIFLAAICAAVYGRVCGFGITGLDDKSFVQIFSAHHFHLLDAFTHNAFMQHWRDDFFRPLQSLSFMMDGTLIGAAPASCHFINILLHFMTVCCLLLLLLLLGYDRWLSLFLAALYAVNPLFTHAVAWIPARGDLLLGFFGLLSFVALIKHRQTGNYWHFGCHGAAFFLAVLSKETALLLPILYASYLLLIDRKRDLRSAILFTMPLWIIIEASYFLLRHSAISGFPAARVFGFAPLAGNIWVLPETLAGFFVPVDLSVMPCFTLSATIFGVFIALGAIAILAIQGRLGKRVLFAALWFVLLSVPGMMYRHEDGSYAYEYLFHRSYLPMIGIVLILAEAIPSTWCRKKMRIVAAAVLVVLCVLTWNQCSYFTDPIAFNTQALRHNPKCAFAMTNRGVYRMNFGDPTGAMADFNGALQIFPDSSCAVYTLFNRGLLKQQENDYQGALHDYNHALSFPQGYYLDALINRGNLKGDLGDIAGAIADLTKSISFDSTDAQIYSDRGTWKERAGDLPGALADYDNAIRLNPNFAEAYGNRGSLFASRGDFTSAAGDFRRAIALNPYLSGVMLDLGRIYLQNGDVAGACNLWRNAAQLGSQEAGDFLSRYCR